MKKIENTKKQGTRTLVAIAIIGVAVYLGFEPLIKFVPDGVAKSVISSSFGAIFVIILTMYLLNKQTEIEQETKKSERVFDEKVQLYQAILQICREMMMDGMISSEQINKLPFSLITLGMLSRDETIKSFREVNNKLNQIYADSDNSEVALSDQDKDEIYKLLAVFANECRIDLEISETETDFQVIEDSVKTMSSTGKKSKDYTRFDFDGESLPKSQYQLQVMLAHAATKPEMTIEDFGKDIPSNPDWKHGKTNKLWVTLEAVNEIKESGKRVNFYTKPNQLINLSDGIVCCSNGTTQTETEAFVAELKANNVRTE